MNFSSKFDFAQFNGSKVIAILEKFAQAENPTLRENFPFRRVQWPQYPSFCEQIL